MSLDTAIYVYAIGVDHSFRAPGRRLLDPAIRDYEPEASAKAIQGSCASGPPYG